MSQPQPSPFYFEDPGCSERGSYRSINPFHFTHITSLGWSNRCQQRFLCLQTKELPYDAQRSFCRDHTLNVILGKNCHDYSTYTPVTKFGMKIVFSHFISYTSRQFVSNKLNVLFFSDYA